MAGETHLRLRVDFDKWETYFAPVCQTYRIALPVSAIEGV
jgi:hypothetical protein